MHCSTLREREMFGNCARATDELKAAHTNSQHAQRHTNTLTARTQTYKQTDRTHKDTETVKTQSRALNRNDSVRFTI